MRTMNRKRILSGLLTMALLAGTIFSDALTVKASGLWAEPSETELWNDAEILYAGDDGNLYDSEGTPVEDVSGQETDGSLWQEDLEDTSTDLDSVPIDGSEGDMIASTMSLNDEYGIMPINRADDDALLEHADLETGTGTQKTKQLGEHEFFDMDKYLKTTGTMNGQNTYDVYLEQAWTGQTKLENAPTRSDMVIMVDQSASISGNISYMNHGLQSMLDDMRQINEYRLNKAKNGEYADIDPSGDVESQMENHWMYLRGIVGFNNRTYVRFDGLKAIRTEQDVTSLINMTSTPDSNEGSGSCYIKDDYLTDGNGDLQDCTRTDLALEKGFAIGKKNPFTYQPTDDEGRPFGEPKSTTQYILITDGAPYGYGAEGYISYGYAGEWHAGSRYTMITRETSTKAIEVAKSMKATGSYFWTVLAPVVELGISYYNYGLDGNPADGENILKNDITSVQLGGNAGKRYGEAIPSTIIAIMSLISSDYPQADGIKYQGGDNPGTETKYEQRFFTDSSWFHGGTWPNGIHGNDGQNSGVPTGYKNGDNNRVKYWQNAIVTGDDPSNKFGRFSQCCESYYDMYNRMNNIMYSVDSIARSSTNMSGYAAAESYLIDELTDPFEVTDRNAIQVFAVPRIPKNLGPDGTPTDLKEDPDIDLSEYSPGLTGHPQYTTEFRWGEQAVTDEGATTSEWVNVTDQVVIDVSGNKIKITGWDYEVNGLTIYDKDQFKSWPTSGNGTKYKTGDYGYKLVVIIPMNAKVTFGGNSIITNDPRTSGFYPSDPQPEQPAKPVWSTNTSYNPKHNDYVDLYPVPKVDLNINYKITGDNAVVYAPQTEKIHDLLTDAALNQLWYTDPNYSNYKTMRDNAKMEMDTAGDAYNEAKKACTENTDAQIAAVTKALQAYMKAQNDYEDAQALFETVNAFIPDGTNNAFVNIHYTFTDPNGTEIATMDIPHGKAYVEGPDGGKNIDWVFKAGYNSDSNIKVSGKYTIKATVTPVDTVQSPVLHVHTEADTEETKGIYPYASTDYSCTGSTAAGSKTAVTITKEVTGYLYTLEITFFDSSREKQQAIDFAQGTGQLVDMLKRGSNIHLVSAKWVCTDGVTPSVSANEPGVNKTMKVGSGVDVTTKILQACFDVNKVQNVSGTVTVTAEDGDWIPVNVLLSRQHGNLNKDVGTAKQSEQKTTLMKEDDNIFETVSSVKFVHVCDVISDHDCTEDEFAAAKRTYDRLETEGGDGKVRFLMHVLANPIPTPEKSTSTPSITMGEDIKWHVAVHNNREDENPKHRDSDYSLIDILPWVGDDADQRIDPNTNHEGSNFHGDLYYKSVTVDYSGTARGNGRSQMFYTTDTNVRSASENQMLGTASDNNITWTEAKGTANGAKVTYSIPRNAVAIRLDSLLGWDEVLAMDMVANVNNLADQKAGDYYHNKAITLNGKGVRSSNVVATSVTTLYLSGTVWYDNDSDGIMTEEPKASDVMVTLYTKYNPRNGGTPDRVIDGVQLVRAYDAESNRYPQYLTQEDGNFLFDNLAAGTYYVVADNIPDGVSVTAQHAGAADESMSQLDSEAEQKFLENTDHNLDNTAWVKEITVKDKGVPNQNVGLKPVLGKVRVGKTLDQIYYPSAMSDEERQQYRIPFVFILKNTTTGTEYAREVFLDENTIHPSQDVTGKHPKVWAEFTDLPLGNYELTEVHQVEYTLDNATSEQPIVFNKGESKVTFTITSALSEFEIHLENKCIIDPPAGDENGVVNLVNMRIPVKLEIIYVGDDPISNHALTEYTFQASDFDPRKGGDMIVTYDDGSQISISAGTLRFDQVTLNPATVTNEMNTGEKKLTVTGYYAEKGRLLKDSYKVGVDLKPIHKFQINFDANGSRFDDSHEQNSVRFGYDEKAGHNYVTGGEYKDVANGGLTELAGFTQCGWNTKEDGTGTQYGNDDDGFNALDAIGLETDISSITLYANWVTNVTFDANGGTLSGGTTDWETAASGKPSVQQRFSKNQSIATGMVGEKTNFKFVLWNTKPDGTGETLAEYNDNHGGCQGPVTFYAIYYQSDYAYTGSVQTFTAPVDGWYQFELYGGNAGKYVAGTGLGGYSRAEFYLKAKQTLYVLVGGSSNANPKRLNGSILNYHDGWKPGWNGGGSGRRGRHEYVFTGGGGATDIRLTSAGAGSTDWQTGLETRIMVAGGAGGSDDVNHEHPSGSPGGGNGGGLTGSAGISGASNAGGRPGTQTTGYALGMGENSKDTCGGAGGGGYYGGYAIYRSAGAGGGSGYISGMTGCTSYIGWTSRNTMMQIGGNTFDQAKAHIVLTERS